MKSMPIIANVLMTSMPTLRDDIEYLKELIKQLWEDNKRQREFDYKSYDSMLELVRQLAVTMVRSHAPWKIEEQQAMAFQLNILFI